MSAFTEASLLREVSRVQHDKTIQAIRDMVDTIPTKKPAGRNSWDTAERSATEFRKDLISAIQKMRELD